MQRVAENLQKDCIAKSKKLSKLTETMDCLVHSPKTNIRTFNVFFNALNNMKLDPSMEIYHKYYEILIQKWEPTVIVFTTLLKAVRISEPSRYKFIGYFLNEMERYNIEYDAFTINQMILLCSKHLDNKDNIIAANNWFDYFMSNLIDECSVDSINRVFKSYLNVAQKIKDDMMLQRIHSLCLEYSVYGDQDVNGYSRSF